VTHGERITAAMAARGYHPTGQSKGTHVEFVKEYAAEDGRRCRVVAFIAKPTPLDPEPTFLGAHVSVSRYFHVREVLESPEALPALAAEDLQALMSDVHNESPPRSVFTRPCGLCDAQLTEYRLTEEGTITCLDPSNCPNR